MGGSLKQDFKSFYYQRIPLNPQLGNTSFPCSELIFFGQDENVIIRYIENEWIGEPAVSEWILNPDNDEWIIRESTLKSATNQTQFPSGAG